MKKRQENYWLEIFEQVLKHPLGFFGLVVFSIFLFLGIYAPFFASSKPFVLVYDGTMYFPFFKYLFYQEFYTKKLDIFFNILMFTLPVFLLVYLLVKRANKKIVLSIFLIVQLTTFSYLIFKTPQDPAVDRVLSQERFANKPLNDVYSWSYDLKYMNNYAKVNLLVKEILREKQQARLQHLQNAFEEKFGQTFPTLWNLEQSAELKEINYLKESIASKADSEEKTIQLENKLNYLLERRSWIDKETKNIQGMILPFISHFHWEEDAGGSQSLNQMLSFIDVTRINRKNLIAALLFGIRISLSVGIVAVGISLIIGIPIGAIAGFYGGKVDILTCRLIEIWESMPTFFMLLIVVSMLQSKSIFIVVAVIGLFGWTTFTRYIRGEFLKQKNLPYVEACYSQGFHDSYIIYIHILPNAISPILTLLSFSIMGAITAEAGLSFLGLGEEGACSWGVLMDEGRSAFPAESYLLWPPAILLTTLLISIALIGDALRDAIDPKLR